MSTPVPQISRADRRPETDVAHDQDEAWRVLARHFAKEELAKLQFMVSSQRGRAVACSLTRLSSETRRFMVLREHLSVVHNLPPHNAARQRAIDLGLTPLDSDQRECIAAVHTSARGRIAIFSIGTTWFMIASTSGAVDDEAGNNLFAEVFSALLALVRPLTVVTSSASRLGRSPRVANEVQRALLDHVNVVELSGSMPCRLWNTDDVRRLQADLSHATSERDNSQYRLVKGDVMKNYEGRYRFESSRVPYGYELDDNGVMVLSRDPDVIAQIRAALKIVVDRQLKHWQKLQRLGEIGLVTRRTSGRWAAGRRFDELQPNSSAMRTFTNWAELYATGTVVSHRAVTVSREEIAGVAVEVDDETGKLQVPFVYNPGVPEGGWAEPSVLEALLAGGRPGRNVQRAPRSGRDRLPLAGVSEWAGRDGARLRLIPLRRDRTYTVARVPGGNTGAVVRPASIHSSSTSVASMNVREVHSALADAVLVGLSDDDLYDRIACLSEVAQLVDHDALHAFQRDVLVSDIEDAQRQVDKFMRLIESAADVDTAALYEPRLAQHLARKRDAEAQLEQWDAAPPVAPSTTIAWDGTQLSADIDYVTKALERLASLAGPTDAETADSIYELIHRLEFDPNPYEVEGRVWVELPGEDEAFVAGPYHFTVPNRAYRMNVRFPAFNERLAEILQSAGHMVTGRDSMERALIRLGMNKRAAGLLSRALPSELADTAAHLLGLGPMPDVDVAYVDHIRSTYFAEPFAWRPGEWAIASDLKQLIIDTVAAHGGVDVRTDVVMQAFTDRGLSLSKFDYARRTKKGFEHWKPVAVTGRCEDWGRRHQFWSLHRCPHCGSPVDFAILVPEIRCGLLCRACRRMPVDGSPTFPASYLDITLSANAASNSSDPFEAGLEGTDHGTADGQLLDLAA